MHTDWFKFYAVSPHTDESSNVPFSSLFPCMQQVLYKGLLFSLYSLGTCQAGKKDNCQLNQVWTETTFLVPSYNSYLATSTPFLFLRKLAV